MSDSFTILWENLDFGLHKLTHLLKATESVSENDHSINDTIHTLICLAIEQVEETRELHLKLHKHHYATKKETKTDEPHTRSDTEPAKEGA
jgi:hypothetical protein